jgi:hypothetical protein
MKNVNICECCGIGFDYGMPNTKYCSACAVFTLDLRKKLAYYKAQTYKLKLLLYKKQDKRWKDVGDKTN